MALSSQIPDSLNPLPATTQARFELLLAGIRANDDRVAKLLAAQGILGDSGMPDGDDSAQIPLQALTGCLVSLAKDDRRFFWEVKWPECLLRATAVLLANHLGRRRLARRMADLFFPRGTPVDPLAVDFLAKELPMSPAGLLLYERFEPPLPRVPLEVAVRMKAHPAVLRTLVARGDHPNLEDEEGFTPLFSAVCFGEPDTIGTMRSLLAMGANPNHRDRQGIAPLHHAVGCRNPGPLRALLAAGANVHVRDRDGITPLLFTFVPLRNDEEDFAWAPGQLARILTTVRCLIAAGADPNAMNKAGDTGLHIAAHRAPTAFIQKLVRLGFDPDAENHEGHTPAQVAYLSNNGDAFRALTRRKLAQLPVTRRGVALPAPCAPRKCKPVLADARLRAADWIRLFARIDALSPENLAALATNPHLPDRFRRLLLFAFA